MLSLYVSRRLSRHRAISRNDATCFPLLSIFSIYSHVLFFLLLEMIDTPKSTTVYIRSKKRIKFRIDEIDFLEIYHRKSSHIIAIVSLSK